MSIHYLVLFVFLARLSPSPQLDVFLCLWLFLSHSSYCSQGWYSAPSFPWGLKSTRPKGFSQWDQNMSRTPLLRDHPVHVCECVCVKRAPADRFFAENFRNSLLELLSPRFTKHTRLSNLLFLLSLWRPHHTPPFGRSVYPAPQTLGLLCNSRYGQGLLLQRGLCSSHPTFAFCRANVCSTQAIERFV